MNDALTRRRFLKIAGAGTAGAALFGSAATLGLRQDSYLPKGGSKMNVVLVNLDSLRRDHVGVYGNPWIKTPNLDALAGESLRFTRPYPESIPTINARRAPGASDGDAPRKCKAPDPRLGGRGAGGSRS